MTRWSLYSKLKRVFFITIDIENFDLLRLVLGRLTDESNLKFPFPILNSLIPATRYAILKIHQEKSLCKFFLQPGLGLATALKGIIKTYRVIRSSACSLFLFCSGWSCQSKRFGKVRQRVGYERAGSDRPRHHVWHFGLLQSCYN